MATEQYGKPYELARLYRLRDLIEQRLRTMHEHGTLQSLAVRRLGQIDRSIKRLEGEGVVAHPVRKHHPAENAGLTLRDIVYDALVSHQHGRVRP